MQRWPAMAMRPEILSWLRRRRERTGPIDADSDMLVRELGPDAYSEARLVERRAKCVEDRRHWRDVALAVARKTGKRVGLDTATRMSLDADSASAASRNLRGSSRRRSTDRRVEATHRRRSVRIVFDPRERHDFVKLGDLSDNVRIKRGGPFMHLKSYAIDGEMLRTGSANFSTS